MAIQHVSLREASPSTGKLRMRVKRISLDTNILDDKMKRFLTGANGFAL
ncbi:MAG: hypothetical protein ACYC1J_11230 [Acidithiobacillus ferrooxidans]|jgi:hypothetical protein|uniref:Uncharacterized protein n=1 Tax=mine drainage metagenome TaxID=410659 RepID=E6QEJ0_9ZZZZ